MLGTTSGHLIALDPITLKRINSQRVFDSKEGGISAIKFEPTQMVFVASRSGKVRAMNIIK